MSLNNQETASSSSGPSEPRPPLSRPPVPCPSATPDEVRNFIAEYIHYVNAGSSRAEAEERASIVEADGERIYEMTLAEWKDLLQFNGSSIYNMLQKGEYGAVSMAAIGRLSKRLKRLYFPYFPFLDPTKADRAITTNPSRSRLPSPSQVDSSSPSTSSVTFVSEKQSLNDRTSQASLKSERETLCEDSRKCGRHQDNRDGVRSRRTYANDTSVNGREGIARSDTY